MSRSGSGLSDCWCEKSWLMRIRSSFGTPFLFRPRRRLIAVHRHHRQEQRHPLDQVTFCVQGVISPLLANIALDGLERLFEATTKTGKPSKPSRKKGSNRGVILIRYADDFVAVAPSKEVLEEHVIPKVEAFPAGRGLSLSQEKPRVTTIDNGFSFLGFEARKFRDGKLLIRPDKAKVLAHLREIKTYLDANKQAPAG